MLNRGLLLSDFNISNFASILNNIFSLKVKIAPFGSVHSWLIENASTDYKNNLDFIFIWTRPEGVINSFNEKLKGSDISSKSIINDVDKYCSILLSQNVGQIILPIWILPPYYGHGIKDLYDGGVINFLMKMNQRLINNLSDDDRFIFCDPQNWISKLGEKAFNEKSWYLAKIPYSIDLFKMAAEDIVAKLNIITGNVKKLIVLDLDDTLWGGIVGDVGWESLILGGHDPIGEAFSDFQTELKILKEKGFVLAIVSKNEEKIALNAINKHPEMKLKLKDFVTWRINWDDKAANIIDIVDELNIGLQSVVFIDDNPLERARVKESLREVQVIDLPKDKMLYKKTLLEVRSFDKLELSEEDKKKTELFHSEKRRKELKTKVGSLDDWLKSINIKVVCSKLIDHDIKRVVQLFNKTNQMNLSTRRITESELLEWIAIENRKLWTYRVSDKFGDSGLVGIASIDILGNECHIIDFILSCRVFGRKIENIMVLKIVEYCRSKNINKLLADYKKTKKNKPCYDFLTNSGFKQDKNIFSFNTEIKFEIPKFIEIINK